jgi:hypothetical protein
MAMATQLKSGDKHMTTKELVAYINNLPHEQIIEIVDQFHTIKETIVVDLVRGITIPPSDFNEFRNDISQLKKKWDQRLNQ